MADINDLFEAAKKDEAVKARWFKDVKPKIYNGKSDDSARMFFDLALFNNENKYERERKELAEAHLYRYNERERQTKRLTLSIATAVLCAGAYFAPVEHKPEVAQMAAATVGLIGVVMSAHYVSKLRE